MTYTSSKEEEEGWSVYTIYTERRLVTQRILPSLFFSLLFASLGMYAGRFVPEVLFLPIAILELVMIVAAAFVRRKRRVGYAFLYSFTFLSGITLYPAIFYYLSAIGAANVLKALGITVFAYGVAALYAAATKADFNFLAGFLFIGLIALVAMGIVNLFVPFGRTVDMAYSLLGILIFIGYTLFDVSLITRYGVAEEDVPWVVLSLYLDFINLFLFVLRLMGIDVKRD